MTRKRNLILLAFSLCLNAGFLIATLVGHTPSEHQAPRHPIRAYSLHMSLLKNLDLPDEVFQQATDLLEVFMDQRAALIVKKLDFKLETLALLEKNPAMSRKELETRHLKEERIGKALTTLDFDYTFNMRHILPPDKMTLMYANAGELVRRHRDKIADLKKADH
ncbi:hypothetical protein [Desulfoluna sp.]|uniref:hypothetical protein n=1 Tax=Desulfoluna sp. TaxID=2045199 RepID=UPI00261ED938|nr:hypothetical protein [Desulfoluna sp.]